MQWSPNWSAYTLQNVQNVQCTLHGKRRNIKSNPYTCDNILNVFYNILYYIEIYIYIGILAWKSFVNRIVQSNKFRDWISIWEKNWMKWKILLQPKTISLLKKHWNFFGLNILNLTVFDVPCSFAVKDQFVHSMF